MNKGNNEIAIINDALGRLPMYYYKADGQLLISREIRFISTLINIKKFDKMAIAQYLLFGYSLGKRTLLENISRLEAATLINLNNFAIELKYIHRFNFEDKKYKERTIEENANHLVEAFRNNRCWYKYTWNSDTLKVYFWSITRNLPNQGM